MHNEVIFDVETKKLFSDIEGFDPGDLGISIISIYERRVDSDQNEVQGKMFSFWEHEIEKIWTLFQEADRIIGFNTIGFDVPALKPYAKFPLNKLPHFDIMAKLKDAFGKRIPLDAIAKETLDREKTDDGLNAVYYWQKGDRDSLEKLKKYCEADVLITKEIYEFVVKNGYLLFKDKWNTLQKVELDFSYPATPDNQVKLF